MTDRQREIAAAEALIGCNEAYIRSVWQRFASGWDGAWCSETACVVSYLAGNIGKIKVSNYAEGLVNKFKAAGRLSNTPEPGDFVFFGYDGVPDHTGRVIAVSGNYITTVEGNIGGVVARRIWHQNAGYIYKYGKPYFDDKDDGKEEDFDMATLPRLTTGSTGYAVRYVQAIMNDVLMKSANPKLTISGTYDAATAARVKAYQQARIRQGSRYITVADGIWGSQCWNDAFLD